MCVASRGRRLADAVHGPNISIGGRGICVNVTVAEGEHAQQEKVVPYPSVGKQAKYLFVRITVQQREKYAIL